MSSFPSITTPSAAQRQRMSIALIVASTTLAACDGAPVAPQADALAANSAVVNSALVTVVDDATSRLLVALPADSAVLQAFGELRRAVAGNDRAQAISAVDGASMALDFSRGVEKMDEADRAALALQLEAVRAGLLAEGR